MGDNKLVITTKPKTFYFNFCKYARINLKHESYFIIKYNELLAEHTAKNEVRKLLSKYKHGNDIYEHRKQ